MAICKEMMTTLSSREFDKALVGFQVFGHAVLLAELKALEGRSSPEFQIVVREMKKGIEDHLQKAKALCETIEGQKDTSETGDR